MTWNSSDSPIGGPPPDFMASLFLAREGKTQMPELSGDFFMGQAREPTHGLRDVNGNKDRLRMASVFTKSRRKGVSVFNMEFDNFPSDVLGDLDRFSHSPALSD